MTLEIMTLERLTSLALMAGINLTYSVACIGVAIMAMLVGYKLFDKITPFNTADILSEKPMAVAIFNAAIILGIGICSGIVIGLASN